MLNMAASGGNPTRMAAPVTLMFLRNRRLESITFLLGPSPNNLS
jgi:hypothetical protein